MIKTKVEQALEAILKAQKVVSELCNGTRQWIMRVPAEPDYDPDLLIGKALRLAWEALEATPGTSTGFTALRQACISRQKEWDPGDILTLAYRGNELAGEVGEACNLIKKLERERLGLRGTRATKADLAYELADVIITADLVAMLADIDLGTAVREKFNATSDKYNLLTRLDAGPRPPAFYYCTVCHENPVDAAAGYDTCKQCQATA